VSPLDGVTQGGTRPLPPLVTPLIHISVTRCVHLNEENVVDENEQRCPRVGATRGSGRTSRNAFLFLCSL